MTGEEVFDYRRHLLGGCDANSVLGFKRIHNSPIPVILHALAAVYCKEGE